MEVLAISPLVLFVNVLFVDSGNTISNKAMLIANMVNIQIIYMEKNTMK